MKKEQIHLSDITRILFGQAPPAFLLETFIRTLVIYVALLFVVRWLGKRMSGQLTVMEMAVMLMLGAIVSVSMQVPDRGLLQGVLLLLCTVLFQRGISLIGFLNGKIEDIIEGKASLLVKDGVLQLKQMKEDRISRQQVFSQLRQHKILNLGIVDRLYLEAEGVFSTFTAEEARPGLAVLPPDDTEVIEKQQPAFSSGPESVQLLVCIACGTVKQPNDEAACEDCGHDRFVNAIN